MLPNVFIAYVYRGRRKGCRGTRCAPERLQCAASSPPLPYTVYTVSEGFCPELCIHRVHVECRDFATMRLTCRHSKRLFHAMRQKIQNAIFRRLLWFLKKCKQKLYNCERCDQEYENKIEFKAIRWIFRVTSSFINNYEVNWSGMMSNSIVYIGGPSGTVPH